jgi:hypothetical protein
MPTNTATVPPAAQSVESRIIAKQALVVKELKESHHVLGCIQKVLDEIETLTKTEASRPTTHVHQHQQPSVEDASSTSDKLNRLVSDLERWADADC